MTPPHIAVKHGLAVATRPTDVSIRIASPTPGAVLKAGSIRVDQVAFVVQ
ncbi:MAG TPA: hypothetical protein VGJ60_32520 [Chloroflexota bacterium]